LAARRNPLVRHGAPAYSAHIETRPAKEITVNIIKHMEAAFIVVLAVAGTASMVAEARDNGAPARIQETSVATPSQMAVVTVKAKRLTPAQKLELALAERHSGGRA
jgi:hypothetical protein